MSTIDKLRLAWVSAEERHAQAVRQLAELNAEVDRRRAELNDAQQAYVRALEREVAAGPRSEKPTAEAEGQWDDPGPDFRQLVLQSGSPNSSSRVVAQRAIERMGPKAIEPLLAMLSEETSRWEHRINVVCGVLVMLIVAAMLQLPALIDFTAGYWLMLLCLPLLVSYAKPLGPHKRAAEALSRVDNVRVIGPLIEALELEDRVIVSAASGALKRMLRRLRPGDESQLKESHWQILFRAIGRIQDPELAIAALMALEQVGDDRAIPLVAPLGEGKGVAAFFPHVQSAARDCLEILADQSLRGRAGRTLLRAAHDPESPDEVLLRAARHGGEVDKETLLQAFAGEPNEASD